jgi:hypothetical protein
MSAMADPMADSVPALGNSCCKPQQDGHGRSIKPARRAGSAYNAAKRCGRSHCCVLCLPAPERPHSLDLAEVHMSRKLVGACMAAIAFAGVLGLGWPGAAKSQDKAWADGSIRIDFQGSVNDYATVTVFHEGKAVATKDVIINAGRAEFTKLPAGTYEVRFECPGWKTLIRRAMLTEKEKTAELMPKMVKGDGTLVVGPAPSLQELEARIKSLETAVAKLQGK